MDKNNKKIITCKSCKNKKNILDNSNCKDCNSKLEKEISQRIYKKVITKRAADVDNMIMDEIKKNMLLSENFQIHYIKERIKKLIEKEELMKKGTKKIFKENKQKSTVNFYPFTSKTFRDFSFVCGIWVILSVIARILSSETGVSTALFLFLDALSLPILLVLYVYHNVEFKKKEKERNSQNEKN